MVLRRPRLLAAALLASLAGAARAQPGAQVDPNDPVAVEQFNATMEEAFEDSPFDMNPEGMVAGQGPLGALLGPSVTKPDFARYVRLLELTKEQTDAAATIYRGRLANYEAKGKPLQEKVTKLMKDAVAAAMKGEQYEPENIEELAKSCRDIQAERTTMSKGVFEDLRTLLNKDQEPLWPRVEAAERRNRLLRFQPIIMVPGVGVDLRDLVIETFAQDGMAKPDAAQLGAIDAALAPYEQALDEQAKIIIPMDDAMRSEMITAKPSPEQMERQMKIMTDGAAVGEKVFNATQAGSKSVAGAMGAVSPAARDAFIDRYNAAAFPQIYRRLHAQNVADAALKLADLSQEQRGAINTIREELDAKLKDLRPKAVEEVIAMHKFQMAMMTAKTDEERQKVMEGAGAAMGGTARPGIKQADNDVVKRIRALLSDAQKEALPKRPRKVTPFNVQPAENEAK